jgi:hypothetical protein
MQRVTDMISLNAKFEDNLLTILFELMRLEFYIVETDNFKRYIGESADLE